MLEFASALDGGLELPARHMITTVITDVLGAADQRTSTVLSAEPMRTETTMVLVSAIHSGTAQAVPHGPVNVTHAAAIALAHS